MAKKHDGDESVTIKKYANRRLYNTRTSSYITLDDLAEMVRQNVQFRVVDAKDGEDLTHTILTQIIMEQEASSPEQLLPVSFLRELIAMYGKSMQTIMPAYLEATMTQFRQNQDKLRETFGQGLTDNPIARIAEGNLALMRAAAGAFIPGQPAPATSVATPETSSYEARRDDELTALKEQMAEIQKRLDSLGK